MHGYHRPWINQKGIHDNYRETLNGIRSKGPMDNSRHQQQHNYDQEVHSIVLDSRDIVYSTTGDA